MMSKAKAITFSQYYRTRADECRASGNLFRDPAARAAMFKLAIEYDSRQRKPRPARSTRNPPSDGKISAIRLGLPLPSGRAYC